MLIFIAAVQIIVYVGGIVVLIIFSIFLTQQSGSKMPVAGAARRVFAVMLAAIGFALSSYCIYVYGFLPVEDSSFNVQVHEIGLQLLNTSTKGYALPFEVVSIFIACGYDWMYCYCFKKQKRRAMNNVPLSHILFLSTALFFIGMYGVFTRRNLITILMAVELMLNSVNINFVAFNKYLYAGQLDGFFYTIFIITIAAAEAAVAIAIIINLYRNHHSIDVENAEEMKY